MNKSSTVQVLDHVIPRPKVLLPPKLDSKSLCALRVSISGSEGIVRVGVVSVSLMTDSTTLNFLGCHGGSGGRF